MSSNLFLKLLTFLTACFTLFSGPGAQSGAAGYVNQSGEYRLSTAVTPPPAQANTPEPPPGSTRLSEKDGMTLHYVPAGSFLMGTDRAELWDAQPPHTLYLDGFWIDQTEISNALYAGCVKEGACTPPFSYYYSLEGYENYPVYGVTWDQANTYCSWAGRRLPTEAEWEKAARGTDGRSYPWGEMQDCSLANYSGCEQNKNLAGMPPGSYPAGAGPYGNLDMAGNMKEWVWDVYSSDYYARSPSKNPQGPPNGTYRVLRGGGWSFGSSLLSAARSAMQYYRYALGVGFRCAFSDAAPAKPLDACGLEERLFDLAYREVGDVNCALDEQSFIALSHFQWANRLPVTGRADETTLAALQSPHALAAVMPPPFPANTVNRALNNWNYQSATLAMQMARLGYLDANTQDYRNTHYGSEYEKAVTAFRSVNKLPPGISLDYSAWETLFSPLALTKSGETLFDIKNPDKNNWQTHIYPLAGPPVALAYDGTSLWVATSNGDSYDDNLLQVLPPDKPYLQPAPPVYSGDPEASHNRINGMVFAAGKIWVYSAASESVSLRSFLPDKKLLASTKQFKCSREPCFPSGAFGSDGKTLWLGVWNDLVGINPVTGTAVKTLQPGWLASGSVLTVKNCLWMAGESGYTAVSTDGLPCPGAAHAYTIPSDSAAVYDGKWIWYTDSASGSINAFDPPSGQIIARLNTGGYPSALLFDGSRVWVAHGSDNTVLAFDPASGAMGSPIRVGYQPALLLFDGTHLWVANAGSWTVQFIDPSGYSIPYKKPFPVNTPAPGTATPLPVKTAANTPSPTTTAAAFTRNLYLTEPHLNGEDVRRLQLRLLELGYNEIGLADGDFGSLTDQAVRHFQQDKSLTVDGIVGPLTWQKLFGK